MAKKAKPNEGSDYGIYPTSPDGPTVVVDVEEARTWQQFLDFHQFADGRYPSIPWTLQDPTTCETSSQGFDWKSWFDGIGPWLEQCLVVSQGPLSFDVVYDALENWKVLARCLNGDLVFRPEIIARAIHLGTLVESLYAQQFNRVALTGKKVSQGGSKGGKTSADGRADIYSDEAKKYQSEVDALMQQGLSYNLATEQVATSHRVTAKTVRNHTTNPAPRNRSRHR